MYMLHIDCYSLSAAGASKHVVSQLPATHFLLGLFPSCFNCQVLPARDGGSNRFTVSTIAKGLCTGPSFTLTCKPAPLYIEALRIALHLAGPVLRVCDRVRELAHGGPLGKEQLRDALVERMNFRLEVGGQRPLLINYVEPLELNIPQRVSTWACRHPPRE